MRVNWVGFGLGVLAGALAGGALWFIARRSIDSQFQQGAQQLAAQLTGGSANLQQQLDRGRAELAAQIRHDVPAQVDSALRTTLSTYGITPQMGQRFATIVAYAQSHGWA